MMGINEVKKEITNKLRSHIKVPRAYSIEHGVMKIKKSVKSDNWIHEGNITNEMDRRT